MRKLVIALVAIAIIVAAVWGKNLLASSKKEIKKEKKTKYSFGFCRKGEPTNDVFTYRRKWVVRSSKEIVLSVEVQGLLESGANF